jgi:EVE domain
MRKTWIFQVNPERYDVDAFFATHPLRPLWSATRLQNQMEIGDQVFIWRAMGGDDAEKSGVIAEGDIAERPRQQGDDPDSLPFWVGAQDAPDESAQPEIRVRLRLLRFSTPKTMLKREWLKQDPVLNNLEILRMRTATNYLLSQDHGSRLSGLWSRVGKDWNYAESVAGLWAYTELKGREVSKVPGSAIAELSKLINRVVPGLYNKVMNFRSIDPHDLRKGFKGASNMDRAVWEKFFDPGSGSIQKKALDNEYARLWTSFSEQKDVSPFATVMDPASAEIMKDFIDKDIQLLLAFFNATHSESRQPPKAVTTLSLAYIRDPAVVAIARKRARNKCEVPHCTHDLFTDENGLPYCEAHHIDRLSDGGLDVPDNVACVCPAHHREIHHGQHGERLNQLLRTLRRGESNNSSSI